MESEFNTQEQMEACLSPALLLPPSLFIFFFFPFCLSLLVNQQCEELSDFHKHSQCVMFNKFVFKGTPDRIRKAIYLAQILPKERNALGTQYE